MKPSSVTDEILRLHRLETSAAARFNRAEGSRHTQRRTARLWHAAAAKSEALMRERVAPYSDFT